MPRRSNTTLTPALGDLDENGLERLPDFSEPPKTHDQVLAELDARDERLNGNHAQVRPSEQCGIVAGGGPYPGKRCTYAAHPMNQPHSWEVLSQPLEEQPGHVYDDDQPTLPGVPEPEHSDETSIPTEAQFNAKDFVSAPGLKALAERLIDEHDELQDLQGVEIRYLWKRRGGTSGGNPKLGALQRPGGLLRYFTGGVTFVLWLGADNCRELHMDGAKITACVYHQLRHAELDPDDNDAWRIRSHDFEGFVDELDRFGAWSSDLREAAAHMQKLPLDEALAEVDSDDDDGEESE